MSTKRMTRLALFTTIALIIFTVESSLPALAPIPGIKLGLANIITLVVLRYLSAKDALIVLIMRILLASFFFGQALSLLYSLVGGICCLFIMHLINRLLSGQYIYLTSIAGAIAHNLGQISVAFLITQVDGVIIYLPFLLISGILTGLFTGLCAHFLDKYIKSLFNNLD